MDAAGSSVESSSSSSQSPNSSPATSLAAGDAFEQQLRKDSGFSDAAITVLSDLSNFLALGCVCFEDFSTFEVKDEPGVWEEVSVLPLLPFNPSTSSNLSKLLSNGWIRMQSSRSITASQWLIFRIYVLYSDVGNTFLNRGDKKLSNALENLVNEVDTSLETWNGRFAPGSISTFDLWATADEENSSLFYLFNKIPSPAPRLSDVKEKYIREALEDLMSASVRGLRTSLYPYQRRSAGAMLHRENVSRMELDPRFEPRTAADGELFYYNPRDVQFCRDSPKTEAPKGGILAESMGLGKTLICLALILSTKDHPPRVPVEYTSSTIRPGVASLTDMVVSTINKTSIPWKVEFERAQLFGTDMSTKLEQNPACYEIPRTPQRWNRNTMVPPPHQMMLAATTLIVVPQNLIQQWQSEIAKHVDHGTLKVLVMDDRKKSLPAPNELRSYDIVLFTRNRFDMESRDGESDEGRRVSNLVCRCPYIGATRRRDCRCLKDDDMYSSPLKQIHWKRLIVDEGHYFSSSSTNTVIVANRLVKADHRWAVSGTPAKDLMSVEVDMSVISESKDRRDNVLEQRRHFNAKEDKSGAIDSLGALASTFLQQEPWSRSTWKEYIFRHEDRRLTYSGFSTCLRRTLESMVVKTRPGDVERDIELPPLSHSIIHLSPSLYDIFTANLFTLVLTANAITSERTDSDYLFHKNSQKERNQLVLNLRQSAFFWTGFSEADIMASISTSTKYLDKEGTNCTLEDRKLLLETLECTKAILDSSGWKSLSRSHEFGVFVENWPELSAEHWSFDVSASPLLTGISQLLDAQKFVDDRVANDDPGEGLSGEGIRALAPLRHIPTRKGEGQEDSKAQPSKKAKTDKPLLTKSGIPSSSIEGEPRLRKRIETSPMKPSKAFRVTKNRKITAAERRSHLSGEPKEDTEDRESPEANVQLPPDSEYLRASIVGTTSAKMSYLISQIMEHYKDEKILVFYQGDNIAYYIAQILELLDVKHEIYAKSLKSRLKSEYVVNFDLGSDTRVLLMDVGQAAFGLNLASASRIYFVNPVCRPGIEAQAIRRAHRIGQTKKVFVEVLVLKDSVEAKMHERSTRMTKDEHREARSLEDDGGMREIIQSCRVLPLPAEGALGRSQMAPIRKPEQLWSRPERIAFAPSSRKRKRRVTLEDVTNPGEAERTVIHHDDHPQVLIKRQRISSTAVAAPADAADQDSSPREREADSLQQNSIYNSGSVLLSTVAFADENDTVSPSDLDLRRPLFRVPPSPPLS